MKGLLFIFFAALLCFAVDATYKHCDKHKGLRQSPINIKKGDTKRRKLPDRFDWSPAYYKNLPSSLINTGHTLRLLVDSKEPLRLSSGMLEVPYDFQQLHIHWGDNDDEGSEHQINGRSYPLEMHAVHFQTLNSSLNQYAVVSYFYKISKKVNAGLNGIIDVALAAAQNRNVSQKITTGIKLSELLVSRNLLNYYRYDGSLTAEPYVESVTWIIADKPLEIGEKQLGILRSAAKIDQGLRNNFRCIQSVNGRQIIDVSVRHYGINYNNDVITF